MLTWFAWTLGMLTIPGANWSHWLIAMRMATLGRATRAVWTPRKPGNCIRRCESADTVCSPTREELAEGRQALLATISHDVRTPVTGIVGMVDLLLQRPLDAHPRIGVGVQHSADGLTTMLNNLLDLARVEAGRLEVPQERRGYLRDGQRGPADGRNRSRSASRYRSSVLRARISTRGSTPTRVASADPARTWFPTP